MEQYISKSAIVAEIERLFEKAGNSLGEYRNGAEHTLVSINDFLDTIEVKKEVDFDKEIAKFFGDDDWKAGAIEEEQRAMIKFAKHFFELGFKAQKGE